MSDHLTFVEEETFKVVEQAYMRLKQAQALAEQQREEREGRDKALQEVRRLRWLAQQIAHRYDDADGDLSDAASYVLLEGHDLGSARWFRATERIARLEAERVLCRRAFTLACQEIETLCERWGLAVPDLRRESNVLFPEHSEGSDGLR